jgi:Ca2+-binding RTX toxin-like protein
MSVINGTSGSDQLNTLSDTDAVYGFDGRDFIYLWTAPPATLTVDAGAGDDEIMVQFGYGFPHSDIRLTLGAGQDRLTILDLNNSVATVTDFQTGAGGDVMDLRWFLDQWVSGFDHHSNPFQSGQYFRLVQSGANTILQIDRHSGDAGWGDWVVFENTTATAFVAANFTGASPDGSALQNVVVQGGSGSDTLYDGFGDDFVYGGLGADYLYSGPGDDLLSGGGGDDFLRESQAGNDKQYGDAGNDYLEISQISVTTGPSGRVGYQDGGTGNDSLVYSVSRDTGGVYTGIGGSGDDHISISGAASATIDAGIGSDVVSFDPSGANTITLGSGRDVARLYMYQGQTYTPGQVTHITDFTTGAAGDRLDLSRVGYVAWNGVSSLIGHYLDFQEVSGSTVVSVDITGTGTWQTSIVLDNVKLSDLTPFNLTGLNPNGVAVGKVLIEAEDLTGGIGNDLLIGGLAYDTLSGGKGADRLEGLDGMDILHGDEGADVLIGGPDVDVLYGGADGDLLDGGTGADRLYGEDGSDTLEGGDGGDLLNGGAGLDFASYEDVAAGVIVDLSSPTTNSGEAAGDSYIAIEGIIGSRYGDLIFGDTGANTLYGMGGDDNLLGGQGFDDLFGGIGNDHLYGDGGGDNLDGGLGADILEGGAGFDFARYDNALAGVIVDLGNAAANSGEAVGDTYLGVEGVVGSAFGDLLSGDSGANTLYGQNGDDNLLGGGAADQLYGGNGDDNLYGGAGADILDGGAGIDLAHYDTSIVGVTAMLAQPFLNSGDATGDTYVGIEGLVGSAFNDNLSGDGGDNLLIGQGGEDQISGGAGSDDLFGGLGADRLYGDEGNDNLNGGLGADQLVGGAGTDFARYDDATSGVVANLGDAASNTGEAAGDTYAGVEGIVGTAYSDLLIGDGGANVLYGQDGWDDLKGGAANDQLHGGGGGDNLYGGLGADILDGGDGLDFARYDDAGTGVIAVLVAPGFNSGDAAGDSYIGVEGIVGSAFADNLIGDDGANILFGQNGDDQITGYGGNDDLYGGAGADIFGFRAGSGQDVVHDFVHGQDRLMLEIGQNGSGIVDFATLEQHLLQVDANTVIDLGLGNIVTLLDVSRNSLGAGDFLFV